MGLFFIKRGNAKRTKANMILHTMIAMIAVLMIILLLMAVINGKELFYLKLIFLLAGISSIIDGLESYLQKEKRKVYLLDFGYALVWLLLVYMNTTV
ncbi:hypothetical protein ACQKL5_13440 [Peribacillus sp. NPDC097675]|uniref:hypothetical protein n=1 Tax=Peribacillus sp. NPDC097675 TaxID=3390618 RepID=UPI003D073D70